MGKGEERKSKQTVSNVAFFYLRENVWPHAGVAFAVFIQVLGLQLDDLGVSGAGIEAG